MRGSLETIVGAMFAGKTSELLKRILWAKHQNKKIVVIKPSLDNRYSESKIITHNDLSHECFAMQNWSDVNKEFNFKKENFDMVFLDEIQFMKTDETLENVEQILNIFIKKIISALKNDKNVEIRGFGTLKKKINKAKQVRNPKTNEKLYKKENFKLHFKTGKILHGKLNSN